MITVIPGIIEKDQRELERKISLVSPFVQLIHIEINEDMFVAGGNTGLFSFLKKYDHIQFEAHVTAKKPELYVKCLSGFGFKRIIAPVECIDPREFLSEARVYESEIGLSIETDTPLDEVEPFLEELDGVLVMTAGGGGLGQPFEEGSLSKIKSIHRNLPDFPIEVEGGINGETVKSVADAGASSIVSSTYIFQDETGIGSRIEYLQSNHTPGVC